MQLEAHLHVVGWEREEGSWIGGSLKGALRKIRRWLCSQRRNCTSWVGMWSEGSWNTGSLDEIPPLVMQLEAQLGTRRALGVGWEGDGVLGV